MTLFKTPTARDVWLGANCDRCYRHIGDRYDCPILEKALRTDRKPVEWTRNPRAQLMQDSIKCGEFATRPPLVKRKGEQQFEDVPMFDVEPVVDINYVPVEGWPEKPRKDRGGEHA
jgi:hypothetical protein